ncbi:hypothetical protein MLD38_039479 [Melastoma candidum]|uniref:Uncharacterized protein n=1 Tax=Melastoma candidum TaxID=119954 RepID=A0ACB9L2I9_9MYRT|nr:hypothetical protein MLD38_039479 [Melastoma candidum]
MTKLPDDIVMDILSRLPVKTLMRFKCVSKGWHAVISNPHFVKMHLQRVVEGNWVSSQRIIKTDPLQSLNYEAFEGVDCDETPVECYHDLRVNPDYYTDLVGSCNGLVCVQGKDAMLLLNPCTRQFKIIPGSGSDLEDQREFFHGLGYDPVADDYKFIQGAHMVSADSIMESYIEIYSLKSSSWRTIKRDANFRVFAEGIYLNGALHWLGSTVDKESAMVAFDIVEEKFKELVVLPDVDKNFHPDGIGVHGGCLFAWAGLSWGEQCEVWMMSEYGRQESWILWQSVAADGVPGHKHGASPVAWTSTGIYQLTRLTPWHMPST